MAPKADIATSFWDFHARNPHVLIKLKEIAYLVKNSGKSKFGMKAVFERLRWVSTFETDHDDYKLCNSFTAFYARLLLQEEPDLRGFFSLRASVADGVFGTEKEKAA